MTRALQMDGKAIGSTTATTTKTTTTTTTTYRRLYRRASDPRLHLLDQRLRFESTKSSQKTVLFPIIDIGNTMEEHNPSAITLFFCNSGRHAHTVIVFQSFPCTSLFVTPS